MVYLFKERRGKIVIDIGYKIRALSTRVVVGENRNWHYVVSHKIRQKLSKIVMHFVVNGAGKVEFKITLYESYITFG